jgi:signal transduction histidine kinase
VALPLGLAIAPRIARAHARFAAVLLGPTRSARDEGRIRRLAETRAQAVDAQTVELRRIERDLHDGAQARLVAVGMSLGMAEDLFATDPHRALLLLAEARRSSGQALAELRDLARGIHPPVLAERGLDGAIRALALSLVVPVDVDSALPARPPAAVESAAYFAVAEALANVVKHSGARQARVQIAHADDMLVLAVADDGCGGADAKGGSGLRGIQRRLAVFDGALEIDSPPGGPTTLRMQLPCALSSPRT